MTISYRRRAGGLLLFHPSQLDNLKRLIVFCIISLALTACGATLRPVLPEHEQTNSFNIGEVQQKDIGETMVMKMDASFNPGFIAVSGFQIPGDSFITYPLIMPGDKCKVLGLDLNGNYVCSLNDRRPTTMYGPVKYPYCIVIDQNGVPLGDTSCRDIFLREWGGGDPKDLFIKERIFGENSFKQELIYNGRSKGMLRLQYRQYRSDLDRPVFSEDLVYNLSESREIVFMGMLIEVLDATDSTIKFVVKTPLN